MKRKCLKAAGAERGRWSLVTHLTAAGLQAYWAHYNLTFWFLFGAKHLLEFVLAITATFPVTLDRPYQHVLVETSVAVISPLAAVLLANHRRLGLSSWVVIVLAGFFTMLLKTAAEVCVHWKTLPERALRPHLSLLDYEAWYAPINDDKDCWNVIGPALVEFFDCFILLKAQGSPDHGVCALPAGGCFDGLLEENDDQDIKALTRKERQDLIFAGIRKF